MSKRERVNVEIDVHAKKVRNFNLSTCSTHVDLWIDTHTYQLTYSQESVQMKKKIKTSDWSHLNGIESSQKESDREKRYNIGMSQPFVVIFFILYSKFFSSQHLSREYESEWRVWAKLQSKCMEHILNMKNARTREIHKRQCSGSMVLRDSNNKIQHTINCTRVQRAVEILVGHISHFVCSRAFPVLFTIFLLLLLLFRFVSLCLLSLFSTKVVIYWSIIALIILY